MIPAKGIKGWYIQGSAKRLRPGLVNMRRKNCVLLPAAGRRTQFFLLIFTKPGWSLLAEPCSECANFKCFNLLEKTESLLPTASDPLGIFIKEGNPTHLLIS